MSAPESLNSGRCQSDGTGCARDDCRWPEQPCVADGVADRYTPEGDTVRIALRAWLQGEPPGAITGVWFDDALRALLTLDAALAEKRRTA